MTLPEVILWKKLRKKQLGFKFHRQTPMIHYVVDFYCHELKLAIEVDGKVHNHPEVSTKDLERQQEIETYGVQFLRFENKEAKYNLDDVIQTIEDWIKLNE
jgi:very-short-patch-repair endonuclease